MTASRAFSLVMDLRLEYCTEICSFPDDGHLANTDTANAGSTREPFLADARPAGENIERYDGDPPRKAEHCFLRQIFL